MLTGGGPVQEYEAAVALLKKNGYTCFVCDKRSRSFVNDVQTLGQYYSTRRRVYQNVSIASGTNIACMLMGAAVEGWD